MLDLEFPISQKMFLPIRVLPFFLKNRILIRRFAKEYKGKIYTSEYPLSGKLSTRLLRFLGAELPYKKVKHIKMHYTSLKPAFKVPFFRKQLQLGNRRYGKNHLVALGTIAVGIHGNEPLLSVENLARDLQVCLEENVSEVVIFRLGGLNKNFLKILEKTLK